MDSGHGVGAPIRGIRKHQGSGPAKIVSINKKRLTKRMNLREQAVS